MFKILGSFGISCTVFTGSVPIYFQIGVQKQGNPVVTTLNEISPFGTPFIRCALLPNTFLWSHISGRAPPYGLHNHALILYSEVAERNFQRKPITRLGERLRRNSSLVGALVSNAAFGGKSSQSVTPTA